MKIIELKNDVIEVERCSKCPMYYQSDEWRNKIRCPTTLLILEIASGCPLKDKPHEYKFDGDGRFGPG